MKFEIILLIIMIIPIIHCSIIYYSRFLMQLYENGIILTNRTQGKNTPPPKSRKQLKYIPHFSSRSRRHYVPLTNIEEIWAINAKIPQTGKDNIIVIKEKDGTWYLFDIPFFTDIDRVLINFKFAFEDRWSDVFQGSIESKSN